VPGRRPGGRRQDRTPSRAPLEFSGTANAIACCRLQFRKIRVTATCEQLQDQRSRCSMATTFFYVEAYVPKAERLNGHDKMPQRASGKRVISWCCLGRASAENQVCAIGKFLPLRHFYLAIERSSIDSRVDYIALCGDELWQDCFYFIIDEINSTQLLNRFLVWARFCWEGVHFRIVPVAASRSRPVR
jgi:hypothetical protein